ncbi:hypothetical protein PG999_003297 [Apiospora kogelbergensis]|uniref:Cytochrome P450 n=1 Tax=Apiospora kogelbergensis TaxID=1337665 RepID=A0AAW0R347_9PEZI
MEYTVIQLLWSSASVLFMYYLIDLLSIRKHTGHPLIGNSWKIAPRLKLNFDFFWDGTRLLQEGYQKARYKSGTFQLVRNQGNIVILPASLLEELSVLPSNVASPHGALEHDLLGSYTGLNLILESRIHHSIVQRKLTPRLSLLTPALEAELRFALQESFPKLQHDNWAEFQPYQIFGKISARLTALFRTIVILRILPQWVHPLVSVLLPSFWRGRHYLQQGKDVLEPKIRELIQEDHTSTPDSFDPETSNVLYWLTESAKGADRDPDTIAHIEVLLALASVHTTLLRMVNVLYDITASGHDLVEELRDEVQTVFNSEEAWANPGSYDRLYKLDSVLRESQRMSPPTTLGMKRLFKEDFTFSSGLHMSKGTYVCMPIFAIENDPANTSNPEQFDGLRNYRARCSVQVNKRGDASADGKEYLFSSPGKTVLNFGYGKSACPGRFFASLIIKMLFVKLLTEYDFQFLPGRGRPSNLMAHEFLFSWPWEKMVVRRRGKTVPVP